MTWHANTWIKTTSNSKKYTHLWTKRDVYLSPARRSVGWLADGER